MIKYLWRRLWRKKQRPQFLQVALQMTDKEREEAMIILSLPPQRTYLLQMLDEMVRQGIYLSPEKQAGTMFLIELFGDKMKEWDKVRKIREDQHRRVRESAHDNGR